MKNLNKKTIILMVILLVIILLSIFAISPLVSSPKFHTASIKVLDDKKMTVMGISTAAVTASVGLGLIPGDATTPIANQILQLSSKLIIVIGAIFLEKTLLTLTGYLTFTFIIPISCILFGIYVFTKKEFLKKLAIKLVAFGIIIVLVVPCSIQISKLIEATYNTTINQTIEDAKNAQSLAEDNSSQENQSNTGNSFTTKVKETISNIGEGTTKAVQKAGIMLNNFIDAIAVLIITSCVIPIVVLFVFTWIVKIIFNVNIPVSNIKKLMSNKAKEDDK